MIQKDNDETRREAAKLTAAGGVIVFRTDTFYGLGADPFNRAAIVRIRELKGREDGKPILILVSNESEVRRFIEDAACDRMIAIARWPGPLTLIGAARPEVPVELTAGTNSLGVRLPDDENVRALVRACGGALTATSANVSGEPPARTAVEAQDYFPEQVDLIIDSGDVETEQPSTVLDLTGAKPRLVREGLISRKELEGLL
ncbi:MAG TPA: L-threonylcarbamoyladenylate synthase [Pyrinomonadaceae bacterium]|jgi:L-threonylcarbamoyladenylate synthase|nr:L-threonylcarbamoyladenylate synthase [Pyrinomonadaceae bacterium]